MKPGAALIIRPVDSLLYEERKRRGEKFGGGVISHDALPQRPHLPAEKTWLILLNSFSAGVSAASALCVVPDTETFTFADIIHAA